MTSGGNNFNDVPYIVPTREITTKTDKISFSRPWPLAYFLNGPDAAASVAITIIRHWSLTGVTRPTSVGKSAADT